MTLVGIHPESNLTLEPIDVEGQLVTHLYERVSPSVVHITAQEIILGNRRYLIGGDILTAVNDQPINDWISNPNTLSCIRPSAKTFSSP